MAPSLIIGVSGDANRAELGTAFALASRRLKTSSSAPFTIEQLTTALADLEGDLKTPRLRLRYRVPANPAVVDMDRVLEVKGERYDATNLPSDVAPLIALGADAEDLARLSLAAAVKALYAWRWESAADASRVCLRLSKEEDIRDEALNVLAATLLVGDEATKALDALRKAVEGEWNLVLQTNLAVIASEVSPATAIDHMSYLISGAEDSEHRRQAALIAVALWKRSQGEEKESDDEDDFDPPPRSVLDAIYDLVNSTDLTEEDFYDLGMFLARVDSDQLRETEIFSGSPYVSSPSARLIRARISGFFEYVAEFGPVAKAGDDWSRPWIRREIEQYVETLRQVAADGDNKERQKFAIVQSFRLFEAGLPTTSVERVLLLVVLILNFEAVIDDDGAPKDVVDEWLAYAFRNVRKNRVEMEGEQKTFLLEAIAAAAHTLMVFRHKEIVPTLRKAENQSLVVAQKTSGFFSSFTVDKSAVRTVARQIVDFCAESKKVYERLLPMLQDQEARDSVVGIVRVLEQIDGRVNNWVGK